MGLSGYLAAEGFVHELLREIQYRFPTIELDKLERYGDLVLVPGSEHKLYWARNTWRNVERVQFQSISEAAKALKSRGLRWVNYPQSHHRRASLISEQLNTVKVAPLVFGRDPLPTKNHGSWLLTSEMELLVSSQSVAKTPHGDVQFEEDKTSAPSRAYLKMWEALTRLGIYPKKEDRCIDLGSSPGGWTWALARLAGEVFSVDKAPLAPSVAQMKNVRFLQDSAFELDLSQLGQLDWICSDVICAPERLLQLVKKWESFFPKAHFICTIKFKGECDFKVIDDFSTIPHSQIVHLTANKHELTWIRSTLS